eukprot:m.109974 g.109974  ORF g.109974 m.109974 type:complete len:345 (+) comp15257_c0_seq3:452-1486(+)
MPSAMLLVPSKSLIWGSPHCKQLLSCSSPSTTHMLVDRLTCTDYAYHVAAANASLGWRWTFVIFGAPGFLFAILAVCTMKEPQRGLADGSSTSSTKVHKTYNLITLFRDVKATPSFYMIVVASSVRQIAGFTLGAYLPSFFQDVFDLSKSEYNHTMLLVGMIVLVCGSTGSLLGGFLSDKLMRRSPGAKAHVIAVSQLIAAPFIAGTLFANSRATALGILIPSFVTAETWLGPAAAIVQDVTRPQLRAQASAVYMAVNTLVGGCGPMIVGAMTTANVSVFGLTQVQSALLLIVPTCYVLSALLFGIVGLALRRRQDAAVQDARSPLLVNHQAPVDEDTEQHRSR